MGAARRDRETAALRKDDGMKKCYIVGDFLSDENKLNMEATASACGYETEFFDTAWDADGKISDGEIIYSDAGRLAEQMPHLRWFHTAFAGVESCIATGMFGDGRAILTNSSGAYGRTISEYIVMMTLMLMRQMPAYLDIIEKRGWERDLPLRSIAESRIAIVGTGDIGSNTARCFRGMGAASITGFSRSGRPNEDFDAVCRMDAFKDNVKDIDVLVICVPGTPETDKIISAEYIRSLPEKALVINVGRGTTVDQDALIEALESGAIAGAGIDVMVPEPLPADHPLWTTRNCIVTPHIAGDMGLPYTVDVTVDLFCENFRRFARGEELINRVDVKAGYPTAR